MTPSTVRRLIETIGLLLLLWTCLVAYGLTQRLIALQVRVAVLEGQVQQVQLQHQAFLQITTKHLTDLDRVVFGQPPVPVPQLTPPWILNRFGTIDRRLTALEERRLVEGK